MSSVSGHEGTDSGACAGVRIRGGGRGSPPTPSAVPGPLKTDVQLSITVTLVPVTARSAVPVTPLIPMACTGST